MDKQFEKQISKFMKQSDRANKELKRRTDRKHGIKPKPIKRKQENQN